MGHTEVFMTIRPVLHNTSSICSHLFPLHSSAKGLWSNPLLSTQVPANQVTHHLDTQAGQQRIIEHCYIYANHPEQNDV